MQFPARRVHSAWQWVRTRTGHTSVLEWLPSGMDRSGTLWTCHLQRMFMDPGLSRQSAVCLQRGAWLLGGVAEWYRHFPSSGMGDHGQGRISRLMPGIWEYTSTPSAVHQPHSVLLQEMLLAEFVMLSRLFLKLLSGMEAAGMRFPFPKAFRDMAFPACRVQGLMTAPSLPTRIFSHQTGQKVQGSCSLLAIAGHCCLRSPHHMEMSLNIREFPVLILPAAQSREQRRRRFRTV